MAGRFKLRKTATQGSRLRGTVAGVRDVLRGKTIAEPVPPDTFPPKWGCQVQHKHGWACLVRGPHG